MTTDRHEDTAVDTALLSRATAGDPRAFRELIERHRRRAHAVAFDLVRDPEDAREVVQDAFMCAHRRLGNFEGHAAFGTWLYRIVVNRSIDMLRKRKPGRTTELDESTADVRFDGFDDPHTVLARKQLGQAMQVALDQLTEAHRATFLLRELDGLSYEEIATSTGVSTGTVMSRLFYARRGLQTLLAEQRDE